MKQLWISKKYRIIIWAAVIILSAVFWIISPKEIKVIKEEENFSVDVLMKNVTWNTNFEKKIPYRAGDDIETAYMIKNLENKRRKVVIDTTSFNPIVKLTHIQLEGEEQKQGQIAIWLEPYEVKALHIQGKAKVNSDNANKEVLLQKAETNFKVVEILPPLVESGSVDIASGSVSWEKTTTTIDTITRGGSSGGGISSSTSTTAVSTPKLKHIVQSRFKSYLDNALIMDIDNSESIDYVMIGEKSFKGTLDSGKFYIIIPKETFATGEYFLAFLQKNGGIITTDVRVSFEYSQSKINVADIVPNRIKNDTARFVVLQGNGFSSVVSVQLNNGLILKQTEFLPINDNVLAVKIPQNLEPGEYFFTVMDTETIYELKQTPFIIQ